MNNLERSWMYERLDGRGGLYSRFVTGVDEFIQFASSQPNRMSGDKVRYSCAKCQNYKFMDVETVKCHFYQSGIIENYFIWKHQGERDDISETSYGNALHGGSQPIFEENPYRQMILDAAGPYFSQGSNWQSYSNSEPESSHSFQHSMEEDPNPVPKKFYDLLDAADAELYPDNIVLDNYYQTKKLVRSLGLPVKKIDCYESRCMLYWDDDDEHLISCKFCSKPRFKHCVSSRKRKSVPYKRMYYFSLFPRLKRLYASHATGADIRWHHDHKKEDGVMRHQSDSEAWNHFNESHPFFAVEPRNVRLGLCLNGFQPISQSGRKYSSWPVIVTPYNLPPGMCMKESYMFLTIIVPGPAIPNIKLMFICNP
ncbi:hypothetical protein P3S67_031017 [Capsicum chacoense]